jgi:hypothetical protein
MIFVDREGVPVPASLTKAMTDEKGELAKVRASYPALLAKPAKSYNFKAYKADDVQTAIETLFNDKCAYCETHFGAGGPVDIEHFRPKGEVLDDPAHPGYWWLAMRWENLLYSCIDCNRMRGQVIVTEGMSHEQVALLRQQHRRSNAGKKNAFPIRGVRRLPEDCDLDAEDALLIDPTRIHPDEHLTFDADASDTCLAVARETPNGPDPLGQASIHVFGLNRSVLVDARSMLWRKLKVQGEFIREALDEYEQASTPAAEEKALNRAVAQWRELERWADAKEAYSGVTKVFLDKLKAELEWEGA